MARGQWAPPKADKQIPRPLCPPPPPVGSLHRTPPLRSPSRGGVGGDPHHLPQKSIAPKNVVPPATLELWWKGSIWGLVHSPAQGGGGGVWGPFPRVGGGGGASRVLGGTVQGGGGGGYIPRSCSEPCSCLRPPPPPTPPPRSRPPPPPALPSAGLQNVNYPGPQGAAGAVPRRGVHSPGLPVQPVRGPKRRPRPRASGPTGTGRWACPPTPSPSSTKSSSTAPRARRSPALLRSAPAVAAVARAPRPHPHTLRPPCASRSVEVVAHTPGGDPTGYRGVILPGSGGGDPTGYSFSVRSSVRNSCAQFVRRFQGVARVSVWLRLRSLVPLPHDLVGGNALPLGVAGGAAPSEGLCPPPPPAPKWISRDTTAAVGDGCPTAVSTGTPPANGRCPPPCGPDARAVEQGPSGGGSAGAVYRGNGRGCRGVGVRVGRGGGGRARGGESPDGRRRMRRGRGAREGAGAKW